MKKEEVEKIEQIIDDYFHLSLLSDDKTFSDIFGERMTKQEKKRLAKVFASQITIDEGEVMKVLEEQDYEDMCGCGSPEGDCRCGKKHRKKRVTQALKKADIWKIEEGKNGS